MLDYDKIKLYPSYYPQFIKLFEEYLKNNNDSKFFSDFINTNVLNDSANNYNKNNFELKMIGNQLSLNKGLFGEFIKSFIYLFNREKNKTFFDKFLCENILQIKFIEKESENLKLKPEYDPYEPFGMPKYKKDYAAFKVLLEKYITCKECNAWFIPNIRMALDFFNELEEIHKKNISKKIRNQNSRELMEIEMYNNYRQYSKDLIAYSQNQKCTLKEFKDIYSLILKNDALKSITLEKIFEARKNSILKSKIKALFEEE